MSLCVTCLAVKQLNTIVLQKEALVEIIIIIVQYTQKKTRDWNPV